MSALLETLEALRAVVRPAPAPNAAEQLLEVAKKLTRSAERVRIEDLHVDPQYQRPMDREKVQAIREAKAYRQPIKVNRRPDGTLWIVDGQHRAHAAHADGEDTILAHVMEVPQHREQHHETGVMKEVKRIPQGDQRRGRIHPGEFTAGDGNPSAQDGEDTVGVTPYRGSGRPDASYFDSTRWRHFIRFARDRAADMHVTVDAMRKGTGMWEGNLEPTSAWYVHDHDQVEAWAATVGREFNQDAVAVFHEDDHGPHTLYQFPGIHPKRAMADAEAVGLPAATVTGGTLTIISTDDDTDEQMLALAKRIGKRPIIVAGSAEFIPREEYDRYAQPDEEGGSGEGARDLPGGEGVAKSEQGRIPAGDPRRGRIHPGEWTAEEAREQSLAAHAKAREEGREKPKEEPKRERPQTAERRRLAAAESHEELSRALDDAETLIDTTLIASRMGALREKAVSGQMELDIPTTLEEAERVYEQRMREEDMPWQEARETETAQQMRGDIVHEEVGGFIDSLSFEDPLVKLVLTPLTRENYQRRVTLQNPGKDVTGRWDSELTNQDHRVFLEDARTTLAQAFTAGAFDTLDADGRFVQQPGGPAWEQTAVAQLVPQEKRHEVKRQFEQAALKQPGIAAEVEREWQLRFERQAQYRTDQARNNFMRQRRAGDLAGIVRAERAAKDPVLEPQSTRGIATRVRNSHGQPVAMFVEDSPLEDGILYAEHSAPIKQAGSPTFNVAEAEDYISGDMRGPTLSYDLMGALKVGKGETPDAKREAAAKLVDRVIEGLKETPMPANHESWNYKMGMRVGEIYGEIEKEGDAIDGIPLEDLIEGVKLWKVQTDDGMDGLYMTEEEARGATSFETPEEITLNEAIDLCLEADDDYFQNVALMWESEDGDEAPAWSDYANGYAERAEPRDAAFGTVRAEEEERVVDAMLAAGAVDAQSDVSLGGYQNSWAYQQGMDPGRVFKLTLGDTTVTYLPHTSTSTKRDTVIRPKISVDPEVTARKVREFIPTWVREHAIPLSQVRMEIRANGRGEWAVRRTTSDASFGRYDEVRGTKAIEQAVKDFEEDVRRGHEEGRLTDHAVDVANNLRDRWRDAFEGIPDDERVLMVRNDGTPEVRFTRAPSRPEDVLSPPAGERVSSAEFVRLEDVMPEVQTREPMYLWGGTDAEARDLIDAMHAVEGLPHGVSFQGKEENLHGRKPEVAQEQTTRNLVARNHHMLGAAQAPALSERQWKVLLEHGLADVEYDAEEGRRIASANESNAPFSERGMLRVEHATPARAVNVLKRLKLTSGLAEQVPYNVLYHGERRLGRVQPRHPEFLTSDAKVKLVPGKAVIHGLTAQRDNPRGMIESLIESGGVQATSERRRVGIDVRTSSVAGDTGSGLDQYVFCTYGATPQFGSSAFLMLKPTVLERRDIAFSPTDFGGGNSRWEQYNRFAREIGQGAFYKPPTAEQRSVALSRMDASDAEVLLKHSIPWEDVDTLIVNADYASQEVLIREEVEAAKKAGKLPENLKVEFADTEGDVSEYIERREAVLREAYEQA